ncbi:MAG TPA: class I SAM-dependent methyltransferase, partial [Dongiaceae bacterium]|nr:class I SAM-dependent methyltransferase [Dongiaceae bacterium]
MEFDEILRRQRVDKAAAVYSPLLLSVYDLWVYRVAAPRFFRCPLRIFHHFYEQNVSRHHLDIGVGSGSLLQHCKQKNLLEKVSLLDLNPNCLTAATEALQPLPVQTYCADVLQPFPIEQGQFATVGMNFLLHCVPGSFREKGVAFT